MESQNCLDLLLAFLPHEHVLTVSLPPCQNHMMFLKPLVYSVVPGDFEEGKNDKDLISPSTASLVSFSE